MLGRLVTCASAPSPQPPPPPPLQPDAQLEGEAVNASHQKAASEAGVQRFSLATLQSDHQRPREHEEAGRRRPHVAPPLNFFTTTAATRERLSNRGGNSDVVESKIKQTRLGFFFLFLHLNVAASEKIPQTSEIRGPRRVPPSIKFYKCLVSFHGLLSFATIHQPL